MYIYIYLSIYIYIHKYTSPWIWSSLVLPAIVSVRRRRLLAAGWHCLRGWVPQLLQRSSLCDAGVEARERRCPDLLVTVNWWKAKGLKIYDRVWLLGVSIVLAILDILQIFWKVAQVPKRVSAGNSRGWEVRDQTLRLQVAGPRSSEVSRINLPSVN